MLDLPLRAGGVVILWVVPLDLQEIGGPAQAVKEISACLTEYKI